MRYFFSFIFLFCFVGLVVLQSPLFGQNLPTITYSIDTNSQNWKQAQEQPTALSSFIRTLVRAQNLKLQADFIVEEQISVGGHLDYSQRATLLMLNNELVEAQQKYQELNEIIVQKIPRMFFGLVDWSEFKIADKVEADLFLKWYQAPQQYIAPFVDGTHLDYFNKYKMGKYADIEIRNLSESYFQYEWELCLNYWGNFQSLKKNRLLPNQTTLGLVSLPMGKAEFGELNYWQGLLVEFEMLIQKQAVVDSSKLKDIVEMKALGEEILAAVDFIPESGFTATEELKQSKKVIIMRPNSTPNMLDESSPFKYSAELNFIAAASVAYQYRKEFTKGLCFGGRFYVNSVEKIGNQDGASRGVFHTILLPRDTEGEITVDLRCNYLETWLIPQKYTARKLWDTTQISNFTYTIKYRVENGVVKVEPIETAENFKRRGSINNPSGKVEKEFKGDTDAKIELWVEYDQRYIAKTKFPNAIVNQFAPPAKYSPVRLFLLLAPRPDSVDTELMTPLEFIKKYDTAEMRIKAQMDTLGAVKVFYEKGKYETKHQTQATQDELKEWLNRLTNNKILVGALNEKNLKINMDAYATSEENSNVDLAEKRLQSVEKSVKGKDADNKFVIVKTYQIHPNSKRTDKEATRKKQRYVEVRLEWNR